jgi:hypothetical protein
VEAGGRMWSFSSCSLGAFDPFIRFRITARESLSRDWNLGRKRGEMKLMGARVQYYSSCEAKSD